MKYRIRYDPEALDDVASIPPFHLRRIKTAIEEHLARDPFVPSNRRKPILGLHPPWSESAIPFWQLRVDPYRVFYDEEHDRTVVVRMIRLKARGKRTEEIL